MRFRWDIKRGEIIYCDLGSTVGSVQSGIRPCVVVSNDKGNLHSNIYTVVPLTSRHKTYLPTHVGLSSGSTALCEQTTTISEKQILRKKNCSVDKADMQRIAKGIKIALDLDL